MFIAIHYYFSFNNSMRITTRHFIVEAALVSYTHSRSKAAGPSVFSLEKTSPPAAGSRVRDCSGIPRR